MSARPRSFDPRGRTLGYACRQGPIKVGKRAPNNLRWFVSGVIVDWLLMFCCRATSARMAHVVKDKKGRKRGPSFLASARLYEDGRSLETPECIREKILSWSLFALSKIS